MSGRSILSPKHTNRASVNKLSPLMLPSKSGRVKLARLSEKNVLTPSKKAKSLGLNFTIFEDAPANRETPSPEHQSNRPDHLDQENILQPKPMGLGQSSLAERRPLATLSPNEFPAYISYGASLANPVRLTETYYPSNFNNENKSLHKKLTLPSYITPPRKSKAIIFRSNFASPLNEEDYVELHLLTKQLALQKRRQRSMSVGRNAAKLPLVTKPKFDILSN